MSKAVEAGRTGALRLALWAQRRARVVPPPVRRVARRALRRFRPAVPPVEGEDWTVPLVPGRAGGDVESLTPDPPAPEPSRAVTPSSGGAPRPAVVVTAATPVGTEPASVRCVIATGVLDVGGAEEFAAFLARRLPGAGVETVVVYSDTRLPGQHGEGGRLVRVLASEGVPTVRLRPGEAAGWLRAYRPDVISAHYAPDWLLDAAAQVGVAWVETLHGMHSFFHPDSWPRERERARHIWAQVAVSELVRRQYLACNPEYPADRVVTVPNGVERDRVARVDRARARAALGLADEFLFLSLARYCLQKNTFGLVSAFAQVTREHPQAHLLVAGRAHDDLLYFEQTRQHARSLAGCDRIHLRGHCANPGALLAAADAFVLDSFFEGWPLASMQALAAGLPLILSDVGGAREQLGAGPGRGFLVANPGGEPERVNWQTISRLRFRPQDNAAELIDAASAMLRERERWAASRQRLREEAATFSPEVCLRRHAEVLRSAALGKPLPEVLGDDLSGDLRR